MKGTISDFFEEFKTRIGNKFCEEHELEMSEYNSFFLEMPSFVRVDGKIDYNLCKKCFIFGQAFGAFKRTTLRMHNHDCTDECPIICHAKCTCDEFDTTMNGELFEVTDHEFIWRILCDYDGEYPSLKCSHSKCSDDLCGCKWLNQFEWKIDDELDIDYKSIKCATKPYSQDRHLIMPNTLKCSNFIPELKRLFKVFAYHTVAKRIVCGKRNRLTKINPLSNRIEVPINATFQSLDFIANIQIEQSDNATSSIIEQSTAYMLKIYNIRNTDNRPDHHSC